MAKPSEIEQELVGKVMILAGHESWAEGEKTLLTREMSELQQELMNFDT